jgi:hypothetical protein
MKLRLLISTSSCARQPALSVAESLLQVAVRAVGRGETARAIAGVTPCSRGLISTSDGGLEPQGRYEIIANISSIALDRLDNHHWLPQHGGHRAHVDRLNVLRRRQRMQGTPAAVFSHSEGSSASA